MPPLVENLIAEIPTVIRARRGDRVANRFERVFVGHSDRIPLSVFWSGGSERVDDVGPEFEMVPVAPFMMEPCERIPFDFPAKTDRRTTTVEVFNRGEEFGGRVFRPVVHEPAPRMARVSAIDKDVKFVPRYKSKVTARAFDPRHLARDDA